MKRIQKKKKRFFFWFSIKHLKIHVYACLPRVCTYIRTHTRVCQITFIFENALKNLRNIFSNFFFFLFESTILAVNNIK